MKGQLICDWKTRRYRSRNWVRGPISMLVSVRYYGRLSRTEGIFCEVELEP